MNRRTQRSSLRWRNLRRYPFTIAALLAALFIGKGLAQPTEIEWWMGWWWEERGPEIVAEYERLNPGVRIIFNTLPREGYENAVITSILGGDPPDVVSLNWDLLPALEAQDLLFTWDDDLGRFNTADIYNGAMEAVTYNGSVVAIPYRMTLSMAVYYNKAMFEEAGLELPTNDWTFEDLRAYAEALTVPPRYGYGLAAGTAEPNDVMLRILSRLQALGGSIFSEDGTRTLINEPLGVEAVQYWVDMYHDQLVPPGAIQSSDHDAAQLFGAGRLAMFHGGEAISEFLPEYADEEVLRNTVVVASPEYIAHSSGWAFGIPYNAENIDEAVDFVAWFMENLADLTIRPPATISASQDPRWANAERAVWIEAMEWSRSTPYVPRWLEVELVLIREFQEALLGRKTTQQAMDDAATEINTLLGAP